MHRILCALMLALALLTVSVAMDHASLVSLASAEGGGD